MKTIAWTISRLAAAAAIACVTTAAPVFAQTLLDMPTLSFPTKDGQWGCRWTRSCTIEEPAGE